MHRRLNPRWAVLMAILLALAGCGGSDADRDETPNLEAEASPERSPEITDITEDNFDESFYVGRTVTLTGKVTRVITPTSFVLTGQEYDDDSILVLSAGGYDVQQYEEVTVTGTVHRFDYPNYRGYELDDEANYAPFTAEEFLIATAPGAGGATPSPATT